MSSKTQIAPDNRRKHIDALKCFTASGYLLLALVIATPLHAGEDAPMRAELEAAMHEYYYGDEQKAFEGLLALAARGCAKAQMKVSSMKHMLPEEEADSFKFKWLHIAAENGNPQAQTFMATAHYFGRYGLQPYNHEESYKWNLRAAEQGFAPDMRALAHMYFLGQHVDTDLVQALKWALLAIPRFPPSTEETAYGYDGENMARSQLQHWVDNILTAHMEKWQIGHAERLARKWEKEHDYIHHMPETSDKPIPLWTNAIEGGCDG